MFTFTFTTKFSKGATEKIKEITISVDADDHTSPFILGLHRLDCDSKVSPLNNTYIYRMRKVFEHLMAAIPDDIRSPISRYTRESFEDLLHVIEQHMDNLSCNDKEKSARSVGLRLMLGKTDLVLGDGTHIKNCLASFVSIFKSTSLLRAVLPGLSTIPHKDLEELESKAKFITKEQLGKITDACIKDLNDYLKTCENQKNFAQYKIKPESRQVLFKYFQNGGSPWLPSKCRKVEMLIGIFAFLKEQESLKFDAYGTATLTLPGGSNFLNLVKSHSHCLYGTSPDPWFFFQYRLPNYLLTTCFIFLLVKTGWNIASVAHLSTAGVKLLKNGAYELQSNKFKTDDNTPKFVVSKADKYLKICISLLIWNRAQLFKFELLDNTDGNLWHGWNRDQSKPYYPLHCFAVKGFFERHKIPKIPLVNIRPLKAAASYLDHKDMEIVRILLGHSNLDTTKGYIQTNLISNLNEARILEFQKRFENSIAYEWCSEDDFSKRGFTLDRVAPTLFKLRSQDETHEESEIIADAGNFLENINAIFFDGRFYITPNVVAQAILLKKYFKLQWKKLFDDNPDYFSSHHVNTIIYIDIFLKIVKQRRPAFFSSAVKDLDSGITQ